MTRMSASKARGEFSDALNRVAYQGERIVLRRRGNDVAVLVPGEDLRLLEEIEDRIDIEAAKKALKEKGGIPWTKLKKELGLYSSMAYEIILQPSVARELRKLPKEIQKR